ncbi:MAG: hypothetical protein OXR07_03480, partial [Nitrospira sp.]|nr:hypothetical protein [Nitrospira sp.]
GGRRGVIPAEAGIQGCVCSWWWHWLAGGGESFLRKQESRAASVRGGGTGWRAAGSHSCGSRNPGLRLFVVVALAGGRRGVIPAEAGIQGCVCP